MPQPEKKCPDFAANNISTALDCVGLKGKSLPFYVIPVGIYKREGFLFQYYYFTETFRSKTFPLAAVIRSRYMPSVQSLTLISFTFLKVFTN